MTNTKDYLEEFFTGLREAQEDKRDYILLAITMTGFKKLAEKMKKDKIEINENIIDAADEVYVSEQENVMFTKRFLNKHLAAEFLAGRVNYYVSELFTSPDMYFFMYKQYDGTLFTKGTLKDPALKINQLVGISLSDVREMTAEGLQKKVFKAEYETYLNMCAKSDSDVGIEMEDDQFSDIPMLEVSMYDNTDGESATAGWDLDEVIKMRDAMNKFIAKHTR